MNKINFLSKKKVAILGASVPMLFLAYFLNKKKIDVRLLDNTSVIGGAWKTFRYKSKTIRRQSNVIVPVDRKEENNQIKMNTFLVKNFNIKINKIKDKIITPYKFQNKFIYDFTLFLKKISTKNIFKKLKVKKILIENNKIKINDKYIFDFIFIPSYFGINKINTNKKFIDTESEIIKSEHVIAIVKTKNFNKIYYSDFFNNFFDRVQFTKEKKFSIFSARITKINKGSNIRQILKELNKLFEKKQILFVKKFKYKNYYRDYNQILKLKKIDKLKSVKYMDTRSFMSFFIQFMNYFKKI